MFKKIIAIFTLPLTTILFTLFVIIFDKIFIIYFIPVIMVLCLLFLFFILAVLSIEILGPKLIGREETEILIKKYFFDIM